MNRAEKRRLGRSLQQNNKNKLWFDNLSVDKKMLIDNYIDHLLDVGNDMFIRIFNKCIISSLDDNLNVDESCIKKIINESDKYIADFKEYIDREGNEGLRMIENKELREEIKTKIKKLMKDKTQKASALKLLKGEYNLPFAELSNLWLECKIEKGNDKALKNLILSENDINPKEIIDPEKKQKECATTDSNLSVINIYTEIKGKYGTYMKSSDGVVIDGVNYKDTQYVDRLKDIKNKEYDEQKKFINDQMAKLRDILQNSEYNYNLDIDKLNEISEVFNL